jgi:hypothetical protein
VASDPTRASDTERERIADWLREAAAAGRLTVEELDERMGRAYSAVTRGELTSLIADLPVASAPPPMAIPRAVAPLPVMLPGRAYFTGRWRSAGDVAAAGAEVMRHLVPMLNADGYQIIERSSQRLVLRRRKVPTWAIIIAVVFFPLGLLALLARESDAVTVELFSDVDGATITHVQGVAPAPVRSAVARRQQLSG